MRVLAHVLFGVMMAVTIGSCGVNGQVGSRPLSQALQTLGSSISTALQNPGQTLAAYFPQGLSAMFPFSIANLPSLPPIRFPQRVPQMMMNGVRNATQIIRASLLSPAGSAVAVLAAPLVPLMAMGGPARLAGLHHSMHMGLNQRQDYHSAALFGMRRRRRNVNDAGRRIYRRMLKSM
ncbi:hypothetical protein BIW11_09437 [Tropilaelaps mercedesae]|uniref:Uncharacterized protein n=1 Tax=Tropilaelaps mercedesae TaxID=418985 RepID=A0A1V9XK67_9ACAR|nr:hypothetical protein BIW11_09437 [Tropilaelaps mercedesae]